MTKYNVYKGVQKPIEFKGFKGKFIYLGIGGLFGLMVLSGIIFSVKGGIYGTVFLLTALPGWIIFLSQKQKKGLSNKTKTTGIIIFETKEIIRL